jgi:hypothetical protein
MYRYLFFSLLALLTITCKKDNTGPAVDMIYRRDFEIQAGLNPLVSHHFYLNNNASKYLPSIQAANIQDSSVIQVTNATGELSAIFGDAKLDFISRISVRIFEEGKPNQYIEVAYRDPAPINSGATLGLIPTLANVKNIMRKDRFGIDIVIETRAITTETIPARIDLKFKAFY